MLGGDLFTFLPFENADSAFIYIDSVFCNVYYNCFLLLNDSTAFHNCISDSFNLLKPDLYKREKIKDYDYNCSFTIDEKFCTHCK